MMFFKIFFICFMIVSFELLKLFYLSLQKECIKGANSKELQSLLQSRIKSGNQYGGLVDYSSCDFIQTGRVMPHHICPQFEVKRFMHLTGQSTKKRINLEATIAAFFSGVKSSRICVAGDSMVNQLFHSLEYLLCHFNPNVKRQLRNTFFSRKYNLSIPGSIELFLPESGSYVPWHKRSIDVLESFNYNKGIKSRLNSQATIDMKDEIVSNISRIFKHKKILLYGQPAPELVNYPGSSKLRNQVSKDKVFRHKSDRVILDLVRIERAIAKKYDVHYIDSFEATKSELNELERIRWNKDFSLGRTDRVHFCLPGPVDFGTNAVLEYLNNS